MFSPLLELAGMARNFGVIFAAADRIGGILEAEPIVRDTGTRTEAPAATDVEFDHVCYRYSGTEQDVPGYAATKITISGNTTIFTNGLRNREENPPEDKPVPEKHGNAYLVIEDYGTPLGVDVVINHVGDCFD